MHYEIREAEGKFVLWEGQVNPLCLEKYGTRREAERGLHQYEARDDLDDRISDFIEGMIEMYGTLLGEDEVRAMMKSH